MNAPTMIPTLPSRHSRTFVKHGDPALGGTALPFYYTRDVVNEGTPMYLDATEADLARICVPGQAHGPKCIGLSFIKTYDEGALPASFRGTYQTGNTWLAIRTTAGIRNPVITIIGGAGSGSVTNYKGTVNYNQQAAIGPSGLLIGAVGGTPNDDKLPVYFEGSGVESGSGVGNNMVRIRFDFPRGVAGA